MIDLNFLKKLDSRLVALTQEVEKSTGPVCLILSTERNALLALLNRICKIHQITFWMELHGMPRQLCYPSQYYTTFSAENGHYYVNSDNMVIKFDMKK